MSELVYVSLVPTGFMTAQGIWNMWMSRNKKPDAASSSKKLTKGVVLIFPCYKDIVDVDKWINWSSAIKKILIVEDVENGNISHSEKVVVLKRDNRSGFKAGALNYAIDYLLKTGETYDYAMFFDADHVPSITKFDEIRPYLNGDDVLQFSWNDGYPYETAIDNLTYSARYVSNLNNAHRDFKNLTGSAMAIKFSLLEEGARFPVSITEDYAMTLELLKKQIAVKTVPIVISEGKAPKTLKAFVKQQNRWAEGTVRDARLNGSKIKMTLKQRFDWFMQMNLYLQCLWFLVSLIFLLSGIIFSYLAITIIAIQAICFYTQLRKAPIKFWAYYFILNYVILLPQITAVLRGLTKNKGLFYRTYKKGGLSIE
jgi:cellulose synthase/poly-beta-1,6-N-acetylglucosamine synthase-like glycosyltransferase